MPVVQRLNDLLQRLQDTLEREKAFSSDVAHELRTPLSGLETALEVSASQRRSPEEYERVIQRCLDVSRRMHVMVDNLLMLARAESKQLVVQREPVDLADLSREAWTNFQQRADERKLHIDWRVPADCIVDSDQEKIRLLLHNFFDNAVSYTDQGGRITIAIERRPKATLQVSNTGSRLTAEDATHVFERFWRGDRGSNRRQPLRIGTDPLPQHRPGARRRDRGQIRRGSVLCHARIPRAGKRSAGESGGVIGKSESPNPNDE